MRNLRNLGHWFQNCSETVQGSCSSAWDTSNNDILCTYGPTTDNPLVILQRWTPGSDGNKGTTNTVASWDSLCPSPELPCDKILDIRHFSENLSTCLVFAGGDVVVVRENPLPEQEKIEILGSVDVGIAAAAWSPDEELLVILTNAFTLLYMSREFESITDVTLLQDDLKASKHVSVGWGKAETQFRGKGAKALRDPTMPEKVDQGLKSPFDDGSATISWRGDGAYVAVNCSQESDRRVIRIYTRDGVLDGVTEPVDYLESALSWRPAGNLMAGVQRLEDRVDVVFFERNGLRHGQFSLRLDNANPEQDNSSIKLHWNQDSTVLAVSFPDRVQLWTMGNYHYYLKQEIKHAPSLNSRSVQSSIPCFSWHSEHALTFSIGHIGTVQKCEYGWRIAGGTNIQPFDRGLVSVIDGKTLKVTPLKLSNVPPPMAHTELALESNIIDIAYHDAIGEAASTTTIVVLEATRISLFTWELKTKPLKIPVLHKQFKIAYTSIDGLNADSSYLRQVAFSNSSTIVVLVGDINTTGTSILTLNIQGPTTTDVSLKPYIREVITSTGPKPSLWLWFEDGRCTKSNFSFGIPNGYTNGEVLTDIEIPKNLQSLVLKDIHEADSEPCDKLAFGLRNNGMLLANRQCIVRDCTSFLVTTDHLIYTTSQHLLKFVHLSGIIDPEDLTVPPDTPEADERCRAIERGAKLVSVIPSASALVLQMPRGNLETIYPRALVLPVIRKSINSTKYKKAFLACRNHRVDMNIIHDHVPEQFIKNIGSFIDQVKKVESVDLFLSQLREEDVSITMYKETLPLVNKTSQSTETQTHPSANLLAISKVNRICHAFLDALQSRRSTNLQNIITAYVCQNPPALEEGLQEIASLQISSPLDVDRAVEHICFLADVNRLFDTALGLYDLDMTLLIAQQSQRDPREYLPFLQKLKEQDNLQMKVDIDNHLKRYTKVLSHLEHIGDFERFKKHMVRHDLYEAAIEMHRYQEIKLVEIMRCYAEYLETKSRHKDAGIAYEYLHNYKQAAEMYRLAHMWQEAMACATLIPTESEDLQSFATVLSESLAESKDYKSAATIQMDYLHDLEASARLLCKGYHFAEATRLLGLHNRRDLFETVIDTGLSEGQATMTEMLAEMKTQLNAQVPRIRELRIKKAEEPLSFYDANTTGGADAPDNVSLAGTEASTVGGTLFTRYTNRTGTVATNATRATSKKRMREERKRAMGKKGSVYEEEYLINSVARLMERVNSIGEEVHRLVVSLMRRGMRERARAVEHAMIEVFDLCNQYSPEVFHTVTEEESPKPTDRPVGGDGVMWDSMEQLQTPREAPLLKSFERLSILGA